MEPPPTSLHCQSGQKFAVFPEAHSRKIIYPNLFINRVELENGYPPNMTGCLGDKDSATYVSVYTRRSQHELPQRSASISQQPAVDGLTSWPRAIQSPSTLAVVLSDHAKECLFLMVYDFRGIPSLNPIWIGRGMVQTIKK